MIKESNPVEINEHSVSSGCNNEPESFWWVSKVLKKRSIILSKVKERCRKSQKYKFGDQVPVDVAGSKNLGNENGNSL